MAESKTKHHGRNGAIAGGAVGLATVVLATTLDPGIKEFLHESTLRTDIVYGAAVATLSGICTVGGYFLNKYLLGPFRDATRQYFESIGRED